jgi:hypothetical protein
MTDALPQATAGPPPMVDVQDPLPESTWLWRRVFVFVVTGFVCWQVHRAVDRLADIAITNPQLGVPAFVDLLHWLLALVILMVTYYLVAPSAEQITRMIQVARALRAGVNFTSSAKATAPSGTAESTAVAGRAPPPAAEKEPAGDEGLPEGLR